MGTTNPRDTRRKLTVTVGIPAHNEEANISNVLASILKQRGENFIIERIIVVCDGCTDRTASTTRRIARKHPKIEVIDDEKRLGKMARLNQIYQMNTTSVLFTFDADILLNGISVIKNMVNIFHRNNDVHLVAAHQIPVKPPHGIGRIFYTANRIWEETRIPVNNGDHIHNLQGSATALRASLARHIRYPTGLTADQGYLYMAARQFGRFQYVHRASILYRPPDNVYDFWLLASRSIFQDKKTMVDHFGPAVLQEYSIPPRYKAQAILNMWIQSPLYTSLALLFNILVRLFPRRDEAVKSVTWEMAQSARRAITSFQ